MKILFTYILLILSHFILNNKVLCQDITNVVFEGAGMKGLAYAGAIEVLEEMEICDNLEKVGGTSAGAITALMVSLGYNSQQLAQIISETNFQKFNDGKYFFPGGISRMKKRYGWYRGNSFDDWLGALIEAKTGNADIRFRELQHSGYIDLYITATCINKQELYVFSANNYPNMKVRDAVRISMSVPLYFEAVFIDKDGNLYHKPNDISELDIVVDGGIIGNYPIFIFDSTRFDSDGKEIRIPNKHTLGFRMDTKEQIANDSINKKLASQEIADFTDYVSAFYTFIIESLNRQMLIPEDWERTVSISSVGIGPKIKKFTKKQKEMLIESGRVSSRQYFINSENNIIH